MIAGCGVRALGIDTLSPDRVALDESEEIEYPVHRLLLGAGIVIVENLANLDKLAAEGMTVSLFPLSLKGCDGSPIRAVAWTSVSKP